MALKTEVALVLLAHLVLLRPSLTLERQPTTQLRANLQWKAVGLR